MGKSSTAPENEELRSPDGKRIRPCSGRVCPNCGGRKGYQSIMCVPCRMAKRAVQDKQRWETARSKLTGCVCGESDCQIPTGMCHCGCGGAVTLIATGDKRGIPHKYITGHNGRQNPNGALPDRAIRPHKNARPCACGGWKTRGMPMCRKCWGKDGKPPVDPFTYIVNGKPRRRVPLTQHQYAWVDLKHYERVMQWNYQANWSPGMGTFYAKRPVLENGRWMPMAMSNDVLQLPRKVLIDHISNRETLVNCEDNLRPAKYSQNAAHRGKNRSNTSGCKNVRFTGKTWYVLINFAGKRYYRGKIETFEEACRIQEEKVREIHGEFGVAGT